MKLLSVLNFVCVIGLVKIFVSNECSDLEDIFE